jgi:hypothetical protein
MTTMLIPICSCLARRLKVISDMKDRCIMTVCVIRGANAKNNVGLKGLDICIYIILFMSRLSIA